ncbi:hypothetical protein ACHQM5_017482 [Ranunculus cassubicifolius]
MAEISKDQIQLEINPGRVSMDQNDGSLPKLTIPFFRSLSKSKENSWIVSLFVVVHLVVFAATMIVNDCPRYSNGDCVFGAIGRLSFQTLSENPLLGPSSTTLIEMGALQRIQLMEQHQKWRLLTAPWLHAGIIHLVVNLSSVICIGIHLEQGFGTWRIGVVYTLSAIVGSLMAALFVKNNPAVVCSAALFGLLGAMLSALIRNWKIYSDKLVALAVLSSIAIMNFAIGLLPHVNNFSNLGGLFSGILLGLVLFYNPQLGQVPQNKRGLFEYNEKRLSFKHRLDKPVVRIISLVLFLLILAGGLVAVLNGVNANKYCPWCHHIDCVSSTKWNCNEKEISCKVTVSAGRSTVACRNNDKYRVYPFTEISQSRLGDLCSLICS